MILVLLAAMQASVATAAPPEADPVIVVTGTPIRETERRLRDCLSRNCPPTEDIAATLAHAENLFVNGDYRSAFRTSSAGASRNRKFAAQYPNEVAGLMRANGRIAAHLGESDVQWSSVLGTADALRAGLGREASNVLAAEVEVGDGYARAGKLRDAEHQYQRVAQRAAGLGDRRMEGYALLQRALMLSLAGVKDPPMGVRADRYVRELAESKVPEHATFAEAARLLQARIAARRGDATLGNALVAQTTPQSPNEKPRLVFVEPIDLDYKGPIPGGGSATGQLATMNFDNQWIDVGFRIGGDGRVKDIEILRTSDGVSANGWPAAVTRSITSRRYAPIALPAEDDGIERTERYTLTSTMSSSTGSRVRQRSAIPRIEMLDLSIDRRAVASNR